MYLTSRAEAPHPIPSIQADIDEGFKRHLTSNGARGGNEVGRTNALGYCAAWTHVTRIH